MRQMRLYNFGMHDNSTMMVQAENQGKRGSSDVVSCLQTIFDSRKFGAKHLILWSDGCADQNKNYTMTGFLSSLVKNGEYCSIDHRFLISGHTYLPNNHDFAQIDSVSGCEQKYANVFRCKKSDDYLHLLVALSITS